MITIGTQLTLRPTYGDEIEAFGRVVETTARWLVVRVGRHPWLQPGTSLTCAAQLGRTLSRFASVVQSVSTEDGFAITIQRPPTLEDVNRRSEPRLSAGHAISWSQVEAGRLVGQHQPGVTMDLSAEGLSFETMAEPPALGSLIAVAMDLPIGNMVTLSTVIGVDDSTGPRFADHHHVRLRSIAVPNTQRRDFQRWIVDSLTAPLTSP